MRTLIFQPYQPHNLTYIPKHIIPIILHLFHAMDHAANIYHVKDNSFCIYDNILLYFKLYYNKLLTYVSK